MATDLPRPAFYSLAPGGWRDYLTLLHPPYTAWHLSYVVIGASLAAELSGKYLVATLAAFFLAVGIGAHALDELAGRPLRTQIPAPVLVGLAVVSLLGAAAIGVYGALTVDGWIGVFVVAGVVLVCAYNLELGGGRLHSDLWFALGWGGFPVLTAYFAQTGTLKLDAVLAAVFATALSLAQRRLSTHVRSARRAVASVSGRIERRDGTGQPVTRETLTEAPEAALRAMVVACIALAAALLIMHVA